MARYEVELNEKSRCRMTDGNTKIGIGMGTRCFSTLCTDDVIKTKDGETLCNVKGTCPHKCEFCYGEADQKRNCGNGNMVGWATNTLMMRERRAEAFEQIKLDLLFHQALKMRWHPYGEMMDLDYMERCNQLAYELPEIKFWAYTHCLDLLDEFLDIHGNFAPNFRVWASRDKSNANWVNRHNVPEAWVDFKDDPVVSSYLLCPAETEDGKKVPYKFCSNCSICTDAKDGTKIRFVAHGTNGKKYVKRLQKGGDR